MVAARTNVIGRRRRLLRPACKEYRTSPAAWLMESELLKSVERTVTPREKQSP
jgi:hypothetical protein